MTDTTGRRSEPACDTRPVAALPPGDDRLRWRASRRGGATITDRGGTRPSATPRGGRRGRIGHAVTCVAVVALCVAGCGSGSDGATALPSPSVTARPVPAPPLASDPNAGWFVEAPSGTQMKSNELLEDADRFDLFIDSDEAAVYQRTAVRRVRLRSYYAGASGGVALKLIESADPRRVLRALERRHDGGLGRPYAALPHAHVRRTAVRMESTRAHEVVAHFSTVTFVQRPFVVVVEGYGTSAEVGRRRTLAAARAQAELLTRRATG